MGQTCLPRGEGKHHDVIKGPAVVGVRRVKGQIFTGLSPQVDQESAVNHRHREAAQTLPLADGLVVWGSLVITLKIMRGTSVSSKRC